MIFPAFCVAWYSDGKLFDEGQESTMNMKRRHSGGGHMHHSNHGGGGHRRQHGQQGGRYGFQKPRKNFAALREKYMNMAKDAMGSGDRVLAEYYLQYADHYFRMQQEFLAERAQRYQQQNPNATQEEAAAAQEQAEESEGGDTEVEVNIPNNSNVLPAFLTRQIPSTQQPPPDEKAAAGGSWEEE